MNFPYKHVLLIGATSGIGQSMADRLVEAGIQVTAVGRRKERLDAWVLKHGADRAHGVAFDISRIDAIPQFTVDDIDSVFINAGVQQATDFTSLKTVDLTAFHQQMHVNYTAAVSLVHAFLPFLSGKTSPTSLIFTASNIAIVPAASLPGYSASKAALNAFAMCLRSQLARSNVKVIEIFPPAVQTELHDYMGVNIGRHLGMPLEDFTAKAWRGMVKGEDEVFVGSIGPEDRFFSIARQRRAACEDLAQAVLKTRTEETS